MELTREEFCLFNLKSKIELVAKDGCFMTRRICSDLYLISFFRIYGFYVEVTYDIPRFKTTKVDPVINIAVIELYDISAQNRVKFGLDASIG